MTVKHILVVEDDPDGMETVTTLLHHMNYSVDMAGDGEVASEYLFNPQNRYDAVLIDLALPGKDGWELLNEILSNEATYRVPCIAVTAYHTSKLREDALRAGFTAYFPKPIDGTQLSRELERLI